jgi:hypothetical protein
MVIGASPVPLREYATSAGKEARAKIDQVAVFVE